jgi:hypothetical protein
MSFERRENAARAAGMALVLALACASWARAFGVPDQGTSGGQFLKISPSARAAAMGDAYSALCDDAYGVYFNPAGLGFLGEVQTVATRNSYFQGLTHNFGAIAAPLLAWTDSKRARNEFGAAAFSVTSLTTDGIERRGVVETDDPTDTFGASDFAYALGYGLPLSDRLAAGLTLKALDQRIDASHSTAFALDAGTLSRKDRLSLAGGVRNAGTRVRFANASDPLPLLFYAGAGYRISEEWLFSADLNLPRDHRAGFSFGAEHRKKFSDDLWAALRGGYNSSNTDAEGLTGVSLGAGVSFRRVEFDFAWLPYGDLGNTFRYSLLVRF